MKSNNRILTALLASLALASSASAAPLISWDFSNIVDANQPATGTVVTTVNSGTLLGSSLGNAATGLSTSDLLGGGNLIYSDGNDADGELNVKGWDGNLTVGGDGVSDGWMQFTLTAGAGNTISLTGLSITSWRNGGAAPNNMIFLVNVDGGGLTQFGSTIVDNVSGDGTFDTYSFTDSITGASEIEVRFAPVGPSTENGRGDGNLHINGLTVTGTVVPEPTADFRVVITPNPVNPGNYDFSWDSQSGKAYDLVSATDLVSPVSSWTVWNGQSDLAANPPTNALPNIPGSSGSETKRFFAVVEKPVP